MPPFAQTAFASSLRSSRTNSLGGGTPTPLLRTMARGRLKNGKGLGVDVDRGVEAEGFGVASSGRGEGEGPGGAGDLVASSRHVEAWETFERDRGRAPVALGQDVGDVRDRGG